MGAKYSRWALERYFNAFDLVAPLHAAARLSMNIESLGRVVAFSASTLGIPPSNIGDITIGIRSNFLDGLHRSFPGLANVVFASHDGYCTMLQAALTAENIKVDVATDRTAEALNDIESTYNVDALTLEPVGLKFAIWVDFSKPLDLQPDHVSVMTFARLEQSLGDRVPPYARPSDGVLELARAIAGI
ncbi:MAG: hypothetical protein KF773_14690 [Deltaproteobacteria bacterium]|nr:hypothetical protein [Deltaproteobacteria bacterium]